MDIEETIIHLKNGKKMTICTLIRTFKKEGIRNFVVIRKEKFENNFIPKSKVKKR